MTGTLRNRLQRAEKEVSRRESGMRNDRALIRQAVLCTLSSQQLHLMAARAPEAVSAYESALDAAAVRILGHNLSDWALPTVEDIAREIESRRHLKLFTMFPDEGEFRSELYPKQLEFFRAGRDHREVAFIAGNRCGKSEAGAFETALHLTGRYPDWWQGRRFDHPVNVWVASDTNQTTRDILQAKLIGALIPGAQAGQAAGLGTGTIPRNAILDTRPKSSLPGAVELAHIRHISGGVSTLTFKSYQQGREAFQGTAQDLIVCDEEPPQEVYLEALTRTMGTGSFQRGLMLLLFTPLNGWSEVVEMFLNPKACAEANRYCVQAGWDDVPHLSPAEKESMLAAIQPYQRDARARGIPQLGSGAIYPLAESDISVNPFPIPKSWKRLFGLDVGWNRTGALFVAMDESGRLFAYREHYLAKAEPAENARAIRANEPWVPGVIDPAASGRSQTDGTQLIRVYRDLGLNLTAADNSVDAGLTTVWDLLCSNRLKIFKSLANFWQEFRMYRRDDKGRPVKKNDHLMDCLRYAVMGRNHMAAEPVKRPVYQEPRRYSERGWMA